MRRPGILFIGGGTAGHIAPLAAVAEHLPPDIDVRYFGDPGDFRADLESRRVRVSRIASSKLRRYFSLAAAADFFKFFIGLIQALIKVYWFMPNVAFVKGGPGALPVILACRFYKIPLIIHESDSVPSLTTRLSAKSAKLVAVGFKDAAAALQNLKVDVKITGNPIRSFIYEIRDQSQAKEYFELDPEKPVMLVLGGSQGSTALNTFVTSHLEDILRVTQVIHQVGKNGYNAIIETIAAIQKSISPALFSGYRVKDYLQGTDYTIALDAADVVLTRAGAGALAEIAVKGKPAILVPLPGSAQDHQTKNAYAYAAAGAAKVIEEPNLLPSIVVSEIQRLWNNRSEREKMAAAARGFFIPGAEVAIAEILLSYTNTKK